MSCDWDKLQEKRQNQPRQTPPPSRDEESKDDTGKKKMKNPFQFGGSGGGGNGSPLDSLSLSGGPSKKTLYWVLGAMVLLWFLSGIYIVNPDEEGIVLRFGAYNRTVGPGPHYHLPAPFESVEKPKVTQVLRSEIGFRSMGQEKTFRQGQGRIVPQEASMLTGDENIVNVQFSVQYKIDDPVKYLFNVVNQADVVRNAAEAAMREVIGKSMIDAAITDGKLKIQHDATELLQSILERYQVGVKVLAVQLQDVHPPQEVIAAFKDVASAREDKSRITNEAEAYSNELLPQARGQAAAIHNQAEAYSATRVQGAEGETKRFLALMQEYLKAKDVTRKRLYYEAMEEIMDNVQEKIILPKGTSDRVLPFLPLDNNKKAKSAS